MAYTHAIYHTPLLFSGTHPLAAPSTQPTSLHKCLQMCLYTCPSIHM